MVNSVFKPALCVLELTNRCNLRCPHCASDSETSRCYKMSRGKLQKVFHDLAELGCNLPLRRNCGLCTRFGRDAVPDAIPLAFRSNGDVLGVSLTGR